MDLLIRGHEDLAALRTYAGRRNVRRILLDPATEDPHALSLADRLNKALRSCGCFTAAIFCVAALATLPWLLPLVLARATYGSGGLAALAFAYVCSAAAIGKGTGILFAHLQLMHDLKRLDARLRAQ